MFASGILSALITLVLTVVVWVAVVFYRRRKPGISRLGLFGCLLTPVLFVPGCLAIDCAVRAVVYGDFHYATADKMKGGLPLPVGARDITWHRYEVWQSYRFKISKDELRRWFTDCKNQFRDRPDFAEYPDDEGDEGFSKEMAAIRFAMAQSSFEYTGWVIPADLTDIGGATFAANGAGIRVYYSPGEGRAYCRTNSR